VQYIGEKISSLLSKGAWKKNRMENIFISRLLLNMNRIFSAILHQSVSFSEIDTVKTFNSKNSRIHSFLLSLSHWQQKRYSYRELSIPPNVTKIEQRLLCIERREENFIEIQCMILQNINIIGFQYLQLFPNDATCSNISITYFLQLCIIVEFWQNR